MKKNLVAVIYRIVSQRSFIHHLIKCSIEMNINFTFDSVKIYGEKAQKNRIKFLFTSSNKDLQCGEDNLLPKSLECIL